MRLNIDAHIVLIKCDDIPGMLAAWIPEFDIMTQGRGIMNAIMMAADAARETIEYNLGSPRNQDHGNVRPRRIVMPTRYRYRRDSGDDKFEWEAWWDSMAEETAVGNQHVRGALATADEFMSSSERCAAISLDIEIITGGGIVIANPHLSFYLKYPNERILTVRPRRVHASVAYTYADFVRVDVNVPAGASHDETSALVLEEALSRIPVKARGSAFIQQLSVSPLTGDDDDHDDDGWQSSDHNC